MIYLLELIALGIFVLIGVNIYNGARNNRRSIEDDGFRGTTIDQPPAGETSAAQSAAEKLREFEHASAALKKTYPAVFAMLGGYLNEHTIHEHSGPEGAVEEMIKDWRPRKEEVSRELSKMLNDCDSEDELRAIILAACDALFEEEGYRTWISWLLGRFNTL